ncbi:MAG: hypothetical protein ACSHWU_01005 [Marinicella sp.]
MNKLLALALLCYSIATHSKTWSPVFIEPDHLKLVDEAPQVVEQKLIFRAHFQNHIGMWVYDKTTNQTTNLVPPVEDQRIHRMTQYKGEVYFLFAPADQPYTSKLWKTNGTLAGTTQVSEIRFYGSSWPDLDLVVQNGVLYGRGGGVILTYDGNVFSQYGSELYSANLSKICVFSNSDFITNDYFGERRLVRVNGSIETDLTSVIPEEFRLVSMVEINQSCFMHIEQGSSYNDPVDVIKITESGEVSFFSETPGLEYIHQIFEYDDKVFALKTGPEYLSAASMLGFVGDTTTIDFTWTLENGRFIEPKIVSDKLFIQFNQRPGFNARHYLLDTDLNPELIRLAPDYQSPQLFMSDSIQAMVFTDREQRDQIEVDLINDDQTLDSWHSQGFTFKHATTTDTTEEIYYVLKSLTNGSLGIYTLNDEPSIGKLLNGLWVAPGLNNQGLSIQQGQRALGSNYITVTFYTFRDGDPLWLAGVADYLPNQQSIDIDLFEYAGTNFLELVEEPSKGWFGQINLQMSGCDQLQASIKHDNQLIDFNMRRVDNINHKTLCLTQINR